MASAIRGRAVSLTPEQIEALLAPLDPRRVKQHRGNAHLESWDDKRHLIRVFGFGGFDVEQLELTCICERSVWGEDPKRPFDGRHLVVYRSRVRLVVKDPDGNPVAHFDGAAVGDAVNQPVLGDAHDLALKAANSQALKIACTFLGDRFGLSLYNGGSTSPVVGRTLGNPVGVEHEATEEVNGGELDEARHGGETNFCACGHLRDVHATDGMCGGQRLVGPGNEYDGGDFAPCDCRQFMHEPVDESKSEPQDLHSTPPISNRSEKPALASFDDHESLRANFRLLDDEDRRRLKNWWKQQRLPSITDKDVLTAGQAELVFSFLDRLQEERKRRVARAAQVAGENGISEGERLAARAQALAAKKRGGQPKDAALLAAGGDE
jgi:hypothetical protein